MRYDRAWPVAGAVLALLACGAAAGPSRPAQAVPLPAAALASPNPSSTTNVLAGVSATSARNAWAVGYYHNNTTGDTDTLILRWNGTAWKQVATPNPSSSSNQLSGVSATSASDAWAVGQYHNNTTGETDTLVLHWNGTAWKQVASPNPSPGTQDQNTLNGVAGTSAGDVWAAGFYFTSTNTTQTLILHWNGTAWRQVPSPSPARTTNTLYGVAATPASGAWAAGQYTNTAGVVDTLILRWNGTAWKQASSPSAGSLGGTLLGVSATSASNAWAAGDSCTNVACSFSNTLILHWNGVRWSPAPSPSPGSFANVLSGVSATSASNAWAVGYYDITTLGPRDTLILHWNGVSWSRT